MRNSKYQGLADRVRKQRLEKVHSFSEPAPANSPFLSRSHKSIQGKQIPFSFAGQHLALEVFHQFDPEAREIEWSYYSQSGEFLLQFSFCLKTHEYDVHTIHPGLITLKKEFSEYRKAIQESLAQHYPPLSIVKGRNGEITVERA